MNPLQQKYSVPLQQLLIIPSFPHPTQKLVETCSLHEEESSPHSSLGTEEKPILNPIHNTALSTDTISRKKNFSFNDVKRAVDRMGGIDGIVETMGKVQKVAQSMSQFAPVAKLFMGMLLPRKKNKHVAGGSDQQWTKTLRKRQHPKRISNKTKFSLSTGKYKRRISAKPHRH